MSRLCTLSITDARLMSAQGTAATGASSTSRHSESKAFLPALQTKFDMFQQNKFCLQLRKEHMEERIIEMTEEIGSLKAACDESANLPRHRAAVQLTTLRDEYIDRKEMLETQLAESKDRAVLLQSELLKLLAPYIEACLDAEGVTRSKSPRGTTSTYYYNRKTTLKVQKKDSKEEVHYWQEPMYLFKNCPMWLTRTYPRRLEGNFEGRRAAFSSPNWSV